MIRVGTFLSSSGIADWERSVLVDTRVSYYLFMVLQGTKQVTRAAIEWYGPDRAGVSY